jgi:hypothetical protein
MVPWLVSYQRSHGTENRYKLNDELETLNGNAAKLEKIIATNLAELVEM